MTRSCGSNFLHSYNAASGDGIAKTSKTSGTCAGRLSVAAVKGTLVGVRVYGTNSIATVNAGPQTITGGRHWGCDSCGSQYT